MTERQEHIVREIGLELTKAKAKCKEPSQPDYIYWCGYRDALDKAHSIAQGTTEYKRDPLLIPMLELGVHNTRYRGGK